MEETGNFIIRMRQECKRLRGSVPGIALTKKPQTPLGRRVSMTDDGPVSVMTSELIPALLFTNTGDGCDKLNHS